MNINYAILALYNDAFWIKVNNNISPQDESLHCDYRDSGITCNKPFHWGISILFMGSDAKTYEQDDTSKNAKTLRAKYLGNLADTKCTLVIENEHTGDEVAWLNYSVGKCAVLEVRILYKAVRMVDITLTRNIQSRVHSSV